MEPSDDPQHKRKGTECCLWALWTMLHTKCALPLPKPTFTVQLFSFPCPLHHLVHSSSLAQVCSETWSDCQSVLHELRNRNHHCMARLFTLQRTIFSTTASIGKPAGVVQMATHGPLPSHIRFKFIVLSSHRESISHHPTTTYFKMEGWCSQLGYVHPHLHCRQLNPKF